jgi:hypothetical protein
MNRIPLLIAAAASTDFCDFAQSCRLYRQCTLVRRREHRRRQRRMGLRIWFGCGLRAERGGGQSRLLPNKSVLFARTALWCAARKAGAAP